MLTVCVLLSMGLGALALYAWHREQVWHHRMAERLRCLAADRAELGQETARRRLFESLLNALPQGVVMVDRDLRVRFANDASARLFHRPSLPPEQPLTDLVQEEALVSTVRTALAERRGVVRQIRFVHGGSVPPVEQHYQIETAPLPAGAGHGAWFTVQDITESIRSEKSRQDFIAHVSHELRTPLTVIQGYIETLKGGVIDEPAAAARCLTIMENHGKRLVRLLEDLLTLSRLEGNDNPLSIEPFNLRACVQDAIDHLAPALENREVVFNLDFPLDGGTLHGDRFYWDQVITHLLEYAVKETPDRHLTIQVAALWRDDRCQLRVTDNGVGIPASDMPFVFEPFFRMHQQPGHVFKGTGLGLAIVRRTVEAHGGSIDLQSTPGVETRFTIDVPARLPLGLGDVPAPATGDPPPEQA